MSILDTIDISNYPRDMIEELVVNRKVSQDPLYEEKFNCMIAWI